MKNALIRISVWMGAGFLVSLGWGLYFATANKGIPIEPYVMILAKLTNPTAAVVLYLNPGSPHGLAMVAVTNAATYALLGLIVETVLRRHRYLHLPA